jgi:23S rRNA (cytosine1962-C5)-methyltransferase
MNRMDAGPAHELIDFGGGGRLERFGGRVVDRPHPGALGSRGHVEAWPGADLRFDRDRGWTGPAIDRGPWAFEHEDLALELRTTDAGGVGLFPEHLETLPWLRSCVAQRAAAGRSVAVLNLFASTGLATLALAAAGAVVTHLDASRPTVAWARRNAELSGLDGRPVRWIVDDAVAFTLRESRRGRRYAGILLDPPTYGHGPGARPWRVEHDLPGLLAACAAIMEGDGFVLLTSHTPGFDAERLADLLRDALGRPRGAVDGGALAIATRDHRRLELGAFVRRAGGA